MKCLENFWKSPKQVLGTFWPTFFWNNLNCFETILKYLEHSQVFTKLFENLETFFETFVEMIQNFILEQFI